MLFFFFSSRRRHTRWPRDWSSDVCSSDLVACLGVVAGGLCFEQVMPRQAVVGGDDLPVRLRAEQLLVFTDRTSLSAARSLATTAPASHPMHAPRARGRWGL